MADVTATPSLAEQIRIVAWLRWRTLRNSLHNKNRRMDLIGLVFAGLFSAVFVAGVTIAIFVGTVAIFEQHKEQYFGLLFLGLLAWWQLFPVLLAGFSAQFAFRSMLRFPLSFSAFYIIGLAYGFTDSAALAALIWMATMVAATAVAHAAAAPLMLAICALFALFNATMERLSGAWLEKLLSTRRSREIFFTVFILGMVSLNFLNPIIQKYGKVIAPAVQKSLPYLWLLPSSFAGDAIARFEQGQWGAVLLKLSGLAAYLLAITTFLLARYRKLYAGEELSEGAAPTQEKKRNASSFTEEGGVLELLPAQVLAVFRKELLYLKRNTFLFFGLILPPMMLTFFSVQFAGRHPTALRNGVSTEFFFPGMMAYLVLILMAPAYNNFAYEGRGIQTYFLCPATFRSVLIAKNLVTVAILAVEVALCMLLVSWRAGLPSVATLVATVAAIVFSVAGQLTLANYTSLSFPKQVQFGKMQGQRNSGMAVLIVFGAQILFSGVSALILFTGRWTGNAWLPAEVFAVLAVAALAGYRSALDAFGELAEKKKETLIEALAK